MDLDEARTIIDQAEYWHYRFELPWKTTVPTKPGWAERVQKRRGHFFEVLVRLYGGTLNGKSVLDLACCQGFWSFESLKAGANKVLGLDSSTAFVREAEAVRTVLGISRATFAQAHLEEDPFWVKVGPPQDITLFLGVLYHLTDPIYVLRRAMRLTKEAIVIDGEVAIGDAPCLHLRERTMNEPTTVRSNVTSSVRVVPTTSAIVRLLKDGGFQQINVLEPAAGMPPDYHARTTVSIIATR